MKSALRNHDRCAGAAVGASFTLAGTERKYERSRPFGIVHLSLDLKLDFKRQRVQGVARLDFQRIDPAAADLQLDGVGFEIDEVRLRSGAGGGEWFKTGHEYDGEMITIPVPDTLLIGSVELRYRAEPRRGLYFLAPDRKVPRRPVQVWTHCQDEDARHWFPCHDKPHIKMTTELKVAVPPGFTAISNGELVHREKPRRGRKPWVYQFKMNHPHPSYLVSLVAGRFSVLEDRAAKCGDPYQPREVPVVYFVPPGREKDGWRSFARTPDMVELFSELTGVTYPWTRYSQVVVSDFVSGGMEHTTATTMYEHILLDAKAAKDIDSECLIAHELAHQWFGDLVTCRDWSHAWLNEGFATFFEHVEKERRLGRDEYDYSVASDLDSYLNEAKNHYLRPVVCRDYEAPMELFDRHLYEKGGLVLHMLRQQLGDEIFWRGVNGYLTGHAHGIVETNDLQRALESASGRSLDQFFDQWIYRPGHPILKVKVSWENGLLSVHAEQKQRGKNVAIFSYPLEIEVTDKNGESSRHKKAVTARSDTLVVRLAERPMWVAVDPELLIAGEVSVEAPVRMLQKQLRNGSSARIRWTAAEALGLRDEPTTIAALEASLADEKELWMVCAEAATALGRIGGRQSFGACARHLGVRHPKVRRAVVAALGNFRSPEALRALRSVAARDASYLVEAEACRSAGRTRQSGALTVLQSSLRRKSWADVVRVGALDGLSQLNDDRAVGPVRQRTLYGVGDRERRAAIAALSRLSNDRKVRQHLEDLLEDSDAHVRQDVASALQTIGDVRAVPALRRQLEREQDGRAARQIREALRNMDASDARLRLELRDELEAMRGEIGELRTRLGKIEASLRAKQVQKESQSRGRPTARTRVTGHRTARRIRRKT